MCRAATAPAGAAPGAQRQHRGEQAGRARRGRRPAGSSPARPGSARRRAPRPRRPAGGRRRSSRRPARRLVPAEGRPRPASRSAAPWRPSRVRRTPRRATGREREVLTAGQQREPAQPVVPEQQLAVVVAVGQPARADRADEVEDADQRQHAGRGDLGDAEIAAERGRNRGNVCISPTSRGRDSEGGDKIEKTRLPEGFRAGGERRRRIQAPRPGGGPPRRSCHSPAAEIGGMSRPNSQKAAREERRRAGTSGGAAPTLDVRRARREGRKTSCPVDWPPAAGPDTEGARRATNQRLGTVGARRPARQRRCRCRHDAPRKPNRQGAGTASDKKAAGALPGRSAATSPPRAVALEQGGGGGAMEPERAAAAPARRRGGCAAEFPLHREQECAEKARAPASEGDQEGEPQDHQAIRNAAAASSGEEAGEHGRSSGRGRRGGPAEAAASGEVGGALLEPLH